METFGQRIRKYRKSLGLTQEDLAGRINLTREAISKWESGASENIKLDNLMALCKVFSLSAEELITGKKPKDAADPGGGIHPLSDIKRTLMEHINKLDDGKLTLVIAPIIHDVLDVDPSKVDILQDLVHVVCQPRAKYHENDNHGNDTKREANGE
jgi:DNA-binding XRE family transcriptional regulator